MLPSTDSVLIEVIKAGFNLALLATGWLVGQKIIANWDLRKKQRELDVSSSVQFQQLYGELKEVGRLWRESKKPNANKIGLPHDLRWSLLAKATAAESKYEAVVMKLASERLLNNLELTALGLFRQACQQLRQSMRVDAEVLWSDFNPAYLLFNDLAANVTCLLGGLRPRKSVTSEIASANLKAIAYVRGDDWDKAVKLYEKAMTENLPIAPLTRVLAEIEQEALLKKN
jgi:hypothetical protein